MCYLRTVDAGVVGVAQQPQVLVAFFQKSIDFRILEDLLVGHSSAPLQDIDLAGPHGLQGSVVALRRNTGAAGGIHRNGHLRQGGFQQKCVGDDADVGADPHQLDLLIGLGTVGSGQGVPDRCCQNWACSILCSCVSGRTAQRGNKVPAGVP